MVLPNRLIRSFPLEEGDVNPYESPIASAERESTNPDSDSSIADDSLERLLWLMIGAASTVSLLISLVLGFYGIMLVGASLQGQGRFEGRAVITIPIAAVLIVCSLTFVGVGLLGIRSSARRFCQQQQTQ